MEGIAIVLGPLLIAALLALPLGALVLAEMGRRRLINRLLQEYQDTLKMLSRDATSATVQAMAIEKGHAYYSELNRRLRRQLELELELGVASSEERARQKASEEWVREDLCKIKAA